MSCTKSTRTSMVGCASVRCARMSACCVPCGLLHTAALHVVSQPFGKGLWQSVRAQVDYDEFVAANLFVFGEARQRPCSTSAALATVDSVGQSESLSPSSNAVALSRTAPHRTAAWHWKRLLTD